MVVFQNVTFTYPGMEKPTIKNMCFHLPVRGFVYLVGESGQGKTTMLKLIMKELSPEVGEIRVNGKKLSQIKRGKIPYYRRRIGIVSQDLGLLPDKTVYENVEIAKTILGLWKNRTGIQVAMALKIVGLEKEYNKYPNELSGGEKKKVCIARAIVNNPEMLLVDEPTGDLDPQSSLEIMKLFTEINRRGTAIIIATHDTYAMSVYEHPVFRIKDGVGKYENKS